ncbi:MAG: transposase [Gemmatimonadota bacterium]
MGGPLAIETVSAPRAKIQTHLEGVLAFIDRRLTNARLEGMNNKIRLLSHRAFGFHTAQR